MSEEEKRPLPEGWEWMTTTDVCSSVRDGTHDTPKYVSEGIPLITSKNLCPAGLDFENTKLISTEDHMEISKRSGVEQGDILFAMIGTIGNPVVVRNDSIFSIKNVGLFKKNPEVILSEYLKFWLESWELEQILREQELIKGTTQKFIPLGHLRILPVPLAPLSEQQRIVAEIEKQFTRLDQAVASLKRAQVNLQRYKASVLKAACEGNLVPQDPNDESAEILLQRILAERRRQWEEGEWAKLVQKAQKKVAQSRRKAQNRPARLSDLEPDEWEDVSEEDYARYLPKNEKWKEKYKDPQYPKPIDLPSLPGDWVWTTTGELCDCIVPNRDKPKSFSGDIPWITLPDFSEGAEISISKSGVGLTQAEVDQYRARVIPKGSVVMSCVGRFGISAVAGADIVVNQQLHAFLIPEGLLDSRYLTYAIRDQTSYMGKMATATTIAYLNKTNSNSVPIPLPPLAEQKRIVDEVERRLSVIAANEKTITADLARAERLRQSILQQAFSGRLLYG